MRSRRLKPVRFKAILSANSAALASGVVIPFNAVSDDTHAAFSPSLGRFVAPEPGNYVLKAAVGYNVVQAADVGGYAFIRKNGAGSLIQGGTNWQRAALTAPIYLVTGEVFLNKHDWLEVLWSQSGGSQVVAAATSFFTGRRAA